MNIYFTSEDESLIKNFGNVKNNFCLTCSSIYVGLNHRIQLNFNIVVMNNRHETFAALIKKNLIVKYGTVFSKHIYCLVIECKLKTNQTCL